MVRDWDRDGGMDKCLVCDLSRTPSTAVCTCTNAHAFIHGQPHRSNHLSPYTHIYKNKNKKWNSTVDFRSKVWTCPFCMTRNHFPPHYAENISEQVGPRYSVVCRLSIVYIYQCLWVGVRVCVGTWGRVGIEGRAATTEQGAHQTNRPSIPHTHIHAM